MSPARNRNPGPDSTRDRDSIRQALERALEHAQNAAAEGVAGARDLLDAASLGVFGAPAQNHRSLGELAKLLEQIERSLSGEAPSFRNAAIRSLLAAIDREVERWEKRSDEDPDARAVLRVYLGLREILWELGVRPPRDEQSGSPPRPESKPRSRSTSPSRSRSRSTNGPRVQRIPIQR